MAEAEFDMNASLQERFPGEKTGPVKTEGDLDRFIQDMIPKKHQRKSARIIWDVCEAADGYFSADEVADRLSILVQNGVYAGYGDLKRWAYSEIGPIKADD